MNFPVCMSCAGKWLGVKPVIHHGRSRNKGLTLRHLQKIHSTFQCRLDAGLSRPSGFGRFLLREWPVCLPRLPFSNIAGRMRQAAPMKCAWAPNSSHS